MIERRLMERTFNGITSMQPAIRITTHLPNHLHLLIKFFYEFTG
jgi:hypothetical protein